jgi:plasmid stabilization system protein ParE
LVALLGHSQGKGRAEGLQVRLVYSEQAVADLERLRTFIAEHNPEAANRIGCELVERIEYLKSFPEMGRRVEQAPDPDTLRDAIFGNYVVRYVFHGQTVAVLRVWHHYEFRADS